METRDKSYLELMDELQVSPKRNLLDRIGEYFDGERGYDTLAVHDFEDAIELKDEGANILRDVKEYLKTL